MLTAGTIITLELGHYRLRQAIATSAYGVVWRASGPRGTRDVALKLINQDQMARALPAQRNHWVNSARNEIAFLQSLEPWDERHIVRLLDSGKHDGLPVLALELIACDLGQHMARLRCASGAVPLADILDWVGQLNQALAKVHQYGWCYLDLKPANVLLERQLNRVKLADFGTNRLRTEAPSTAYAGTANWQAPEQFFPTAQGIYASEPRSDYFSLGALFYFLVTGGTVLRFGSACGQAYGEHRSAAAAQLRQHGGGAIPVTLQPDEEQLFTAHIDLALRSIVAPRNDAARHSAPRPAGACGHSALALLRALLQPQAQQRPGHAIQISRMLANIRSFLTGPQQVNMAELVQAVGRPSAHNGWITPGQRS